MIEPLTRNKKYFTDKILQADKTIYAEDLDAQFNNIATYLDTKLKPEIDAIASDAVKGIAGNIGAYLHNVGDGSTDWVSLTHDIIDDYSLDFNKIVTQSAGSVLISNNLGELETVSPNNEHSVLVSRDGQTPIWQQITSNQIELKSLTSQQIGVLAIENFVDNQFITNIVPNVITTANIKDHNITNDQIMDGSINSDHLGVFDNLPEVTIGLTISNIADGAITPDKLQDRSIPITYNGNGAYRNMDIWGNIYGQFTESPSGLVYKQILKSENLKDNTIDENLFPAVSYVPNNYPQAQRVEAAKGFFKDVPYGFQFQSEHIADGSLDLESFDDEVRTALSRL